MFEVSRFYKAFDIYKPGRLRSEIVTQLAASFPYCVAQDARDSNKKMLAFNAELAKNFEAFDENSEWVLPFLFCRSQLQESFSYNYGGHQFGHWAGQLGDGRAVVIGDLADKTGRLHEFQLKGQGLTPFSRKGDGKAVLRSSIREFLASEAMSYLGVPTTRAFALVSTGEDVLRDRFYDGRAKYEMGAVVCRTAPSFLRFGQFELIASRGQNAELEKLVRFVASELFQLESSKSIAELTRDVFAEVVKRTAHLVAMWQSMGFVHGVLNTDNMSMLGLTIDYGPFGFMEEFNTRYTPNTTDLRGFRYCYSRQPEIAYWNLSRLLVALEPLVSGDGALLHSVLEQFRKEFELKWNALIISKFGFSSFERQPEFDSLTQEFFKILSASKFDLTYVFRELSEALRDAPHHFKEIFLSALNQNANFALEPEAWGVLQPQWKSWCDLYMNSLKLSADSQLQKRAHEKTLGDSESVLKDIGLKMCGVNPRFVPKNNVLAQVIQEVETGEMNLFNKVFEVLRKPFDDWKTEHALYRPAAKAERTDEVQMNSCSS